jgi:hypothetical protein
MVSLRNLLSFGCVSSCRADTPNEAALASSSGLAPEQRDTDGFPP